MNDIPKNESTPQEPAAKPRAPKVRASHTHVPQYYGGPAPYGGVYGAPYGGDPEAPPGWLGDLTPRRLFSVARRKWITIMLSVLFTLGVGAFLLHRKPRLYSASAMIEMSVRRPRIMRQDGGVIEDNMSWRSEEIFNTRIRRFQGEKMHRLAMEHAARARGEEGSVMIPPAMFSLVRASNLVNISVMSDDPHLAAEAANAFAHAAEDFMARENRQSSEQAVEWLQTQAAAQRLAIDRVDREMVSFRETIRLDTLEARSAVAGATLQSAGRALAEAENRRLANRELLTALDSAELTPESVERIPRETPYATAIVEAIDRLATARSERDALGARFTDRHPDFIAAEERVQFTRGQITAALRQARETVQADARLLDQQVEVLTRRVEELGEEVSHVELEIAEARAQLAAHQREREAADMSYRGLLNRIEEARLSADEYTAAVTIVDLARPSMRPVSPRPRRTMAMALMLGLALGGGLALVKEVLEDQLQHDEDVERNLGIKALAVVPLLKRVDRKHVAMMCHEDKHSHFTEAFAGLRSQLETGEINEHSHVLLTTSTMPEVGKTICSTNLAICFAQRGERTLLIDFDMRRPQLRRIFGMPPDHDSLIHVLAARDPARFPSLPYHTEIPQLDVICSRHGGKDLSAAEIIGQTFVKDFIDWARTHYDRIILDTPPYGIVSDAHVLAKYADGMLIVLRPGKTRKNPALNAIRHLEEVGVPILGAIVNGLDLRKASFFSHYNYHYSHVRYGYGDHYRTAKTDS